MAISTPVVRATGAHTTTSGSTISSGSASLTAGRRYYVAVLCVRTTETAGATTSIDAIDGVTPTLVLGQDGFGVGPHLSVWTFVAATTASRTVTANFNGTSKGVIQVVEVDGVHESSPNGTPAASNGGDFNVTSVAVSLDAFASAESASLCFAATVDYSAIGLTPRTGWTELTETAGGGLEGSNSGAQLQCQYRLRTTNHAVSATFSTSIVGLIVGFELLPDVGDRPELVSLSPADNATDVAPATDLVMEFDIPVEAGSGNVNVYEYVAPSVATVAQRATDTTGTGDTSSFAIDWTIPGGGTYSEGDIIFIAISKDDDDAFTAYPPDGWESSFTIATSTTARVGAIWRRFAAGASTASVTVTGDNESYAARIWLIRGAHRTTHPYAPTPVTGSSAAANPPNAVFPWGTEPTLVLAIAGGDGNGSASAYPSSSTNTGTHHSGHSTTGSRSWLAYAEFANVTAGSSDPSAFTNTDEQWVAATVAFRPHDPSVLVEGIDITDTGQVTFADELVTVELTDPLEPETDYFVLVDPGAIVAVEE